MSHKFTMLFLAFWVLAMLDVQGQKVRHDEGKTIDHARYRITYETKSVNNTEVTPYVYYTDEMRLDIGHVATRFYSYTKFRDDSLFVEYAKHGGNLLAYDFSSKGSIQWEFYTNYPKGKTTYFDRNTMVQYRIEEPLSTPQWQLVPDSMQTILGYNCHLATCSLGGREWKAWYTDDVPLSYGPYKLGGLPGLVLRASDAEQQFIFECIGIQQVRNELPITSKWGDKIEPLTWQQLYKLKSQYNIDDHLPAGSERIFLDADGNELPQEDVAKLKRQKNVFNLIER